MSTDSLLRKLFCEVPAEPDYPLKLKRGVAEIILKAEAYAGISTEDLVSAAQQRVKSCPADRAVAIALLSRFVNRR